MSCIISYHASFYHASCHFMHVIMPLHHVITCNILTSYHVISCILSCHFMYHAITCISSCHAILTHHVLHLTCHSCRRRSCTYLPSYVLHSMSGPDIATILSCKHGVRLELLKFHLTIRAKYW